MFSLDTIVVVLLYCSYMSRGGSDLDVEVCGLEGSEALPPHGVDELDVETVLVPQRPPQPVHSFDRAQVSRTDPGATLTVSTRQCRLQSHSRCALAKEHISGWDICVLSQTKGDEVWITDWNMTELSCRHSQKSFEA